VENIQLLYKKYFCTFLVLMSLLFVTSLVLGGALASNLQPEKNMETVNLSFAEIFINNVQILLLHIAGIVSFGVFNIIQLFLNGFYAGEILWNALSFMSTGEIFLRIVPHGILEIPALILSGSIGAFPWIGVLLKNKSDRSGREIILFLLQKILKLIFAIILLLLAAAMIEAGVISILKEGL